MERTLSQEERIRRAEEIYQRRRMASSGIRVSSNSVNVSKVKATVLKKMLLQLAICAVIYIIFYLIKNTNYIFSEDVIQKTKELLAYDINFENVYTQINTFIENNKDKINLIDITNEVQENTKNEETQNSQGEENTIIQNTEESKNEVGQIQNIVENQVTNNQVGGIGGAKTNETVEVVSTKTVKKTQMEIDAEYIKKNYSFKIPLKGTITSRYGKREETEIVSANHQGIDIGVNEGTAIYAAMEGTVTVASSEGDFGKHVEITNGDVMTRYAHCSKIIVKQGDKIKQGQKIAEVGQTGNATGPHLHFEIRRNGRVVNPEYVLKF